MYPTPGAEKTRTDNLAYDFKISKYVQWNFEVLRSVRNICVVFGLDQWQKVLDINLRSRI